MRVFILAAALVSWTLTSENLISYIDNSQPSSVLQRTTYLLCLLKLTTCPVLFELPEKEAHSEDGIWPSYFRCKHVFVNRAFKNHLSRVGLAPWLWTERKENNRTEVYLYICPVFRRSWPTYNEHNFVCAFIWLQYGVYLGVVVVLFCFLGFAVVLG